MRIPASEIPKNIHPEALSVLLRDSSGELIKEISVTDLMALVVHDFVCGVATARGKLKEIWLTAPPDVAFRELGETRQTVKDTLHCEANVTTQRSAEHLPKHNRKHHRAHCFSWSTIRHEQPIAEGVFIAGYAVLSPAEAITMSQRIPLIAPLRA